MSATDIFILIGETSLAVAVLVALVLVIRRPFARLFGARAAYVLWAAPALRLFMPELNVLSAPAVDGAIPVYSSTAVTVTEFVAPSFDWIAVAAAAALFLWVAIAFAWIATSLRGQRMAARRAKSDSAPASAALKKEAAPIAKQMGVRRLPDIRVAQDETGPLVMGLMRPTVFLPASFESAYNAEERRLALAHEFAHLSRGDLLTNAAAMLLQAAQWPNPFVHFAAKAFRSDQEAACDAYVIARCGGATAVGDYARAILKSVRGANPAHGLTLGHPLKERLMLLKRSHSSTARRLLGGVGAAALITAGVAATASYGYAAPDETDINVVVDASETVEDDATVVEKNILIFSGSEDEVIFDDVDVGDRVQVMEFEDGSGMKRVVRVKGTERIVRVIGEDGEVLTEEILHESKPHMMTSSTCVANDDEGEPVILEWKNESGDEHDKHVEHTVICLTGVDAEPENRAAAMRKAIDQLEEKAKHDEARRKEMIKALRKQAKELEEKD